MKTLTLLLILSLNVIAASEKCKVFLDHKISYEEKEVGIDITDYEDIFEKNNFNIVRIEQDADLKIATYVTRMERCYEGKGPGVLTTWINDNLASNYFLHLMAEDATGNLQTLDTSSIKLPSKKKYLSKMNRMIKKLKCN